MDSHIPKFDKMYAARLKAYKKIGYELCVNMDGEKQKANAIYDIENYAVTFLSPIDKKRGNTDCANSCCERYRSGKDLQGSESEAQPGI